MAQIMVIGLLYFALIWKKLLKKEKTCDILKIKHRQVRKMCNKIIISLFVAT